MPTRIVLVTHGTDGDVLPFLRVGAALRRRGHDVTVLSHAPYRAAAQARGLDFLAVDTDAAYERHLRATPDLLACDTPAALAGFHRRGDLFGQIRREHEAIVGSCAPGRTVLVGRHTTALSVLLAAETLGVPAMWAAPSPVQYLAAPVAVRNLRLGLATDLNRLRAALGLDPVTDWGGWFRSATVEAGWWPRWFDAAGVPAPARVRLTGFVPADGDPDPAGGTGLPDPVRAVLARAGRPVLVTGGTGRMLHDRFYGLAVAAVRAAGATPVVVTRHRDLVPDGVDWFAGVPFAALLPRVAAAVHHGGIGTVYRALAAGTPQVLLPYGADRPDNANRLARAGLAGSLAPGEWSVDRLAALVATALSRPAPQVPPDVTDRVDAAADLVAGLLTTPAPPPAAVLAGRVAALSPDQRRALAGRLRTRRGGPA